MSPASGALVGARPRARARARRLVTRRPRRAERRAPRWIASITATALVAGLLTVGGIALDRAAAAVPAPGVSVAPPSTFVVGEDVSVGITFTSAGPAVGDQYNLSAGIVVPEGVTITRSTLGTAVVHPTSASDRSVPVDTADCAAVGLEPRPGGAGCQVPLGMRYLVFSNISDLPEGAATSHTLTLRPEAASFPVGSVELALRVSAFTSADERLLPAFPGQRSVGTDASHTSAPGRATADIPVQAIRVEKSEPSPEAELLRGVHQNSTTYTLRLHRSGEGDLRDVIVTDFLPAGLEYLGLGGIDNTSNASGTAGSPAEYPGAPSLTATPAPTGAAPNAIAAPGVTETVETVIPTAAEVAAYGLVAGRVYTKVTWRLGDLSAAGTPLDVTPPVAQNYPDAAGAPGVIELRYRAAVPLFENTLDFDGAGGQPASGGAQTANLDNNRGASTRHGSLQTAPGFGDDGSARSLTNVAGAAAVYAGATAPGTSGETSDTASTTVDAVDVRLIKSVDDGEFRQGQNARYTLTIRTSEYVSAELGDGTSSVVRPNRLVDDLADGICPVFGPDVPVTPGASAAGEGLPRLVIGDPNPGGSVGAALEPAAWNAALGTLGAPCTFPSSDAGATLTGATLTGIAFDPQSGHFHLDLSLAPLAAGSETSVSYTARQNTLYAKDGGRSGATSSGDVVDNTAELMLTTTSIPALDGVTSAGDPANNVAGAAADGVWRVWDDSSASLRARLSTLRKHVLQRSMGSPDRSDLPGLPESAWVKDADPANPFAVGDEVWYRVLVTPPTGADVRNPKLIDFLPDGVEFDPALAPNGRHADLWITPSSSSGLGSCQPSDAVSWLDTFVPTTGITIRENVLTFALGSSSCVDDGTDDRFLPLDTTLAFYVRVTVTEPAAFAEVDLPQNLAKYQQNNVDGDIHFLRDEAGIAIDGGVQLTKGIRANSNPLSASAGAPFSYLSDVDGTSTSETVVQGDQVTFRLDVAAPRVETADYVVWDALPEGMTKSDVVGVQGDGSFTSATAAIVTQTWAPRVDDIPGRWLYSETPRASGWTARVYDPSDAGYPAGVRSEIRDAERSVIVWTYGGAVPGSHAPDDTVDPERPGAFQGLTLGYTVAIPAAAGRSAQLGQQYRNDASIVGFSYIDSVGSRTPIELNGDDSVAVDRTAASGGYAFEDEDGVSSDVSSVFVPDTTPTKSLVSTEVGPGTANLDTVNTAGRIVQGEHATFEYRIEIPARTTVSGAVLSDGGSLARASGAAVRYQYVAGSARFTLDGAAITCGTTVTDFRCAETAGSSYGVLTFPDEYTNTTAAAQVFSARVTVWVKDRDAANPSPTIDIAHNATLTNTATFAYNDPNSSTGGRISHDATASVVYYEPSIAIAKSASATTDVAVGDEVTYRLRVSNSSSRAASYDVVVVDTVPAGLRVKPGSLRIGSTPLLDSDVTTTDDVFGGGGGTITWNPSGKTAALAKVGTTVDLYYVATISDTTGGGAQYLNSVRATARTLPADVAGQDTTSRRGVRSATSSATITATTAAIEKGVRVGDTGAYDATARAPIGETVSYEVRTTLRAEINYYDASISDTLPAGVSLVGTPTVTSTSASVDADDWTFVPAVSPARTWRLDFIGGDIPRAAADREVVVTYDVRLTDAITASTTSLGNTAAFAWGPFDNAPTAQRTSVDDTATVTVPHPSVGMTKQLKITGQADSTYAAAKSAEVDETLTYRLRVTASSGTTRTAAHNVTVVDTVPVGLIVDTTSFRIGATSATPTWAAGVATGAGGTITWTLPDSLAPDGTVDLTYRAAFSGASQLTASGKDNTARVTAYDSFPSGGRTYGPSTLRTATATPLVPEVDLTKQASDTSRTAYVGEPFGWVLTAENAGDGRAQTVVLTDTLPANWTFTEVTSITIGGVAQPITAPTEATPGVLQWTFGTAAVDGTPAAILPAGQSIVIRYTATPDNPEALTTPGVGSSTPHTNRLSAVTTDRRGATGLGTGSYTGPDATDDAYLREADLRLVKDALGGIVAVQTAAASPLRGFPVGTWVAGQSPSTGVYAQPQWRITVTNQGPDAGVGPFRIVDTPTLPDGATTGSWSARLHSSAADTTGTALTLTGAGTEASPFIVGSTSTSLAANGSNRIVLTANVTIDADTEPGSRIANTATVTGRTYEDPDNLDDNTDDAEKTLTESADLAIVKTVATPAPTAVGDAITWNLAVTNHGPSVSRSVGEPITITDTVPEGVRAVTASSTTDWVATLADGSAIPTAGVPAGTDILWTYQGDELAVGTATSVTLSGTILTSHTGALANTAVVHAGDTEDPATPNNTSTVSVTPSDATRLDVTKARVVWDADEDEWVLAAGLTPVPAIVPGEPVSYRVVVSSLGPADARTVRIVDETPTGFTYDRHANIDGTWTRTAGGSTSSAGSPNTGWDTFALTGTLAADASASFVVTYATASTLGVTAPIVNCVEATTANWRATDAQRYDRGCDSTASDRIVDLGIEKTHTAVPGDGRYTAGTVVPFTLTVTNHGPSATGGPIVIADELPVGLSYDTGSARVSVRGAAATALAPVLSGTDDRVATWTVPITGLLDVDETIVVTFGALIDPVIRDGVSLTNAAVVNGPETEPADDPHPNRDTDSVTARTQADVTIVKDVEAGPWVAGTDVEYTLTVTNDGPSAVPASVTDTLPTGLTMVSMTGTGWNCSSVVAGAASGTCTYSSNSALLPVGDSTITVVARIASDVPAETELENSAVVTWTDARGSHTDDDTTEIEVSAVADLGLTKFVRPTRDATTWIDAQNAAGAGEAVAGARTQYRLVLVNDGPSAAVGPLVVADTLPAGVSFVELAPSSEWTASVDAGTNVVTFTRNPSLGGLALDGQLEIVFTVELDADLDEGDILTNTAGLADATLDANDDPNPDNDADPAVIEVTREVDVRIAKTHDADTVRIGDELEFSLVVTNDGPSEATDLVVTDVLPEGLEPLVQPGDTAGLGWTIDSVVLVDPDEPSAGATIVASYADPLGPGEASEPLIMRTLVHVAAYPDVVNEASVAVTEEDTDPANDSTTDDVEVPPLVQLELEKKAVGGLRIGQLASYTIAVTNHGPTEDPGPIVITDALPSGLTFRAAAGDRVDCADAAGTVTCTIAGALDVDETVQLRLDVMVEQGAYPQIENVATLETESELLPDSVTESAALAAVAERLATTGTSGPTVLALLGVLAVLIGTVMAGLRRLRLA